MKQTQAWIWPGSSDPPPLLMSHYDTEFGTVRITTNDFGDPIEIDLIGPTRNSGLYDDSYFYYHGKARCDAAPETKREIQKDEKIRRQLSGQ